MMCIVDVNAQSINGMEIEDIDVNYMRIYGRTNFMGTKMVVRFEFGQRIGFDHNNKNIRDKNGKIIKFNTMIDAMNFISSYGYRLIQAYMTAQGRTIYYHYIIEKIGLIDNNGVNKYVNAQNRSYSKTYGKEGDWEEYKDQKEKKKEDWKDNKNSNDKPNTQTKVEKTKPIEPKPKKAKSNSFLDKLSNSISKNKTSTTSKETVKESQPEIINCSVCNGKGNVSKECHTDNCDDGFITKTCSTCNGNYKNGTDVCYKCEGEGCEYCEYDGTACDACKKGKKKETHTDCNGTGETKSSCNTCNGKGKIIK